MELELLKNEEILRRDDCNVVKVLSFDQELDQIKQTGQNMDQIQAHVLRDEMNIYPGFHKLVSDDLKGLLYMRIEQLCKHGLAYVADSLFVSANLLPPSKEQLSNNVILDVCILAQDFSPTLITLIKNDLISQDKVRSYNLNLAKNITAAVRRFTKEQFSVVFGLVSESDLDTQEQFEKRLQDLRDAKARWCVPSALCMPKNKCKDIIQAFLSSVALTSSVVNDDNSDTLWFLTLEQFCILTENIDKREVTVRTAPSSGGKVLMREVARRLEKSGPTLLLMESDSDMQMARDQKTCSLMLTREQWKQRPAHGEGVEDITNMVTNCKDCPSLDALKGRSWTFLQCNVDSKAKSEEEATSKGLQSITPSKDMSKEELIAIIKEFKGALEYEKQKREQENTRLMDDNAMFLQTQNELKRMLECVSIGGMSLDSGQGSDTSSVTSSRRRYVSSSIVSVESEEGQSGQGMAKRLLKNIKKRLMLGRSKIKAVKEVYVYMYTVTNEDKTLSVVLQSREQELDKSRVNNQKCHINEEGQLINVPLANHGQDDRERLQKYRGACSTTPIHISPSTSTAGYSAPHYWETETEIEVDEGKKWIKWPPILEVGLVEEHHLDKDYWLHGRPRTWCVRVGECETHRPGFCTQVWNQKELVKCFPKTISDTPGTLKTLKYGVVLDLWRGRLGFIDTEKEVVLHKMDVRFRETIYPMFGVFKDMPGQVRMSLLSGNDISMTKQKENLICKCLL